MRKASAIRTEQGARHAGSGPTGIASRMRLFKSLIRQLHKGVLARYGVRPSEYVAWQAEHRD